MKLFISDLDNTLIYSYKHEIGCDKVLVETKDGKELSFMSRYSYNLLDKIYSMICFIPMTTRSLEQYKRLALNHRWHPRFALVSNGGILLRDNEPDAEWYKESLNLIESAQCELEKSMDMLCRDRNVTFEVRKVDGLFVFTKSDDAEGTLAALKYALDLEKVSVFNNGSKVYVLPKKLNKGKAVERIKKATGSGFVISAGDSEFDIPMLSNSDIAVFPRMLSRNFAAKYEKNIIIEDSELFSDRVLDIVHSQCANQIKNQIF